MAISSSPKTRPVEAIQLVDLAAQQSLIRPRLEKAIARVLEHGRYIAGPEVFGLERALCRFSGATHCISCANGTDALTLVMMAEGIGPGDAVFTPSFTFVATAEAIVHARATPVFVDISPETFTLDERSLKRAIRAAASAGLKPRMVIAVDLYGLPADYAALRSVCGAHGLVLTADAAQSFGGSMKGGKVGTLADYTTTSFFPSKPLGCYGDGGAIFTDDDERAGVLRSLCLHGRGQHKYDSVRVGMNSRLDTIQAAILLEKLRLFPDELVARAAVAGRYQQALESVVKPPRTPAGFSSAWASYTVVLPEDVSRDAVQAACAESGISTAVYYPEPLHAQHAYKGFMTDAEGLTATESVVPRVLSLPMHPYLTSQEQEFISGVVTNAVESCRASHRISRSDASAVSA